MNDKVLLVRRLREGGHVKRCHALVHNDAGYTDGKHSFDALCLLFALHPNPSMILVKAVLWHDMAERYAGDLPASAKWTDKALSKAYVDFEDKVFEKVLPEVHAVLSSLTAEDRAWLRAVDMLEFRFWVEDQFALGNQHVAQAYTNILEAMSSYYMNGMPEEVRQFVDAGGCNWTRTPERIDR